MQENGRQNGGCSITNLHPTNPEENENGGENAANRQAWCGYTAKAVETQRRYPQRKFHPPRQAENAAEFVDETGERHVENAGNGNGAKRGGAEIYKAQHEKRRQNETQNATRKVDGRQKRIR